MAVLAIMKSFTSIKLKITLTIFFILLVSFSIYIFIGTEYNSKLHRDRIQKEIFATIAVNVEKVDQYTEIMQQKATDLALTGEVFYKLRNDISREVLDDSVKKYLVDNYTTFPEAIGGGIWYEPYTLYYSDKYYGPYAYWDKGEVVFTWDLNTPEYDYLSQDWYTLAVPDDWDRAIKRHQEYYWTAPYFDEAGTLSLMITVDAFMYGEDGRIIGISTADWSLDEMLSFVEKRRVTEDSHSFLIDTQLETIMANTLDINSRLGRVSSIGWMVQLSDAKKDYISEKQITINEINYEVYYTVTKVGMLYGILVPSSTLQEPITALVRLNIFMGTILGLFLLFVLYLILYWLTRKILIVTEAVEAVTAGDLNVNIKKISDDELGRLAVNFNGLTETLSRQNKEIIQYRENLENKVQERTAELQAKNFELERFNKLTVDRELKMIELKARIEELENK